ncbi:DNA/RNA helicase domain-containing protein [Promicromonospora sukumoe]|uniref:DNA/RNA helicase domain-containing protein n=1 Tax=Promicromonospora sukumoe TaxID=88382 RepID=UPI003654D39F
MTKKCVTDAQFERLTRNTYRVPLTRGMVGTLIYSMDDETWRSPRSSVSARRLVT